MTTLRTLLNSAAALGVLAEQSLPAKASFRLGKILKEVQRELTAYEEARVAACARYGPLDEQTGHYQIPDEKKGAFEAELKDLQESEVEIGGDPVPLSLIEAASVPAAVMAALDWLVVDDAAA